MNSRQSCKPLGVTIVTQVFFLSCFHSSLFYISMIPAREWYLFRKKVDTASITNTILPIARMCSTRSDVKIPRWPTHGCVLLCAILFRDPSAPNDFCGHGLYIADQENHHLTILLAKPGLRVWTKLLRSSKLYTFFEFAEWRELPRSSKHDGRREILWCGWLDEAGLMQEINALFKRLEAEKHSAAIVKFFV